jgi:hypothetical protein
MSENFGKGKVLEERHYVGECLVERQGIFMLVLDIPAVHPVQNGMRIATALPWRPKDQMP